MQNILQDLNLDALYISNPINVRYLSGFSGSTGYVVITNDKKYFITDFRYQEQAKNEVAKNGFEIIISKGKYSDTIKELFENIKLSKIGIEDKFMTLAGFNKLKEDNPKFEFIEIGDKVNNLRLIKTDKEVENISVANRIAEKAFNYILDKIKVGKTENEIAAELEYFMKLNGASGKSFDTVVASGYRSAMPHGVASDKKIQNNEFVKMDYGCIFNGYVSDITRTVFIGDKITDKHKEIYYVVKEAQKLAIENVRAEITGRELDKIARDYIYNKGYEGKFGHGLGHGIGLEIHENPTVSPRGETVLQEGMTITIEPGIYIEGFGGVRIEDDVVVKKEGCEVITDLTKELILLT